MTWSIDPVGSLLVTAVAAALLAGLWLIVRPPKQLPAGRRRTLGVLRLLALGMVLLALLRPTLTYLRQEPVKAALLVLIDASRSMTVEDGLGGGSRWRTVGEMLSTSEESLQKLSTTGDVVGYTFAEELTPLPLATGKFALPSEPAGGASALGAALDDLLSREGGRRVRGVLLLSDGAQRSVPPRDAPPQRAARRMAAEGIPLIACTIGQQSSRDRADLAIADLAVSEVAFVNTPLDITGRLEVEGFANRPLKVQALWENAKGEMLPVDAATITTGTQGKSYPVRLRHTPTEPGEWRLTLRAEPQEGESLSSNNELSTFVTIREGGLRVLYLVGAKRLGGGPDIEQRFIRNSLAASPDIVVTRVVLDYRQPERDLTEQFEPGKYDVVIVDDVDALALDRASWEKLAELVQRGAGVAMLGGYHSFGPGGFRGNPLADVLPIEIGPAERQNFNEPVRADRHLPAPVKLLVAEPFGAQHPIMQLAGARSAATWQALPALEGANRLDRDQLKPNAVVLAEADNAERSPLLVAGQPGAGRALAFAGDSTWRWTMQGFGEPHRRFWRQVVLWLAKKDDTSQLPAYVELSSRRLARGYPLEIAVGVNLPAGQNEADVVYQVEVKRPDGASRDVPIRGGLARSSGVFRDTQLPGEYTVSVTAKSGAAVLGAARARFLVPNQDFELDRPSAEPAVMAQLAALTADAGGRAIAPEELPDVLAKLAEQPVELREEVTARITYWDKWPFFLLLVALWCAEWFLRKKWGLV